MNREQFIGFVRSPETLDTGSADLLEKLVREYPYCQTAEILYALNLNKENNFRFNAQLKTAAAYASDRKLLKQLMTDQRREGPAKGDTAGVEQAASIEFPELPLKKQDSLPGAKDKMQELVSLIDQLKNEVESILTEKDESPDFPLLDLASRIEEVIYEHEHPQYTLKPDIKDYNFSHLDDLSPEEEDLAMSNEALIDRFIQEEPRIEAPPKAEFFDAVDYAKHGLEDKHDIVSETLAKVHLKQGYPDKAIKIYERLSLLYPEKSSFFAAQIEKIKRDQRTDR